MGARRAFAEQGSIEKVLIVLLVFTVAIRLAHLALIAPTPLIGFQREFVDSDMWFFDQWTQRILAGDWLGRVRFHPLAAWQLAAAPVEKWTEWYGAAPTFYKAPFYPYLLAVLAFMKVPVAGVFAVQAFASGLSAWLLYRISRTLFGEVAGLFSVALYALYAPDIHFTTVLLRGPWAVLTTLLVTDRLLAVSARPSPGRAALAGLAVAAAIVVNEAMTPLVILAPLAVAVAGPSSRGLWKAGLGFTAGMLAGVAPVVARNVFVGAPPFQMAVTGSVVLAVFNSASSNPLAFSAGAENFAPVMRGSGTSLFQVLAACAQSFPSNLDWVTFYLRKTAGLIAPFENPDNLNFYYAAVVNPWLGWLPAYGTLLPLALCGAFLAWPERKALWWCWGPAVLALLVTILLTLPLSRYRAVWAIHLIPLAGLVLSRALHWIREANIARLGGLAMALAVCAALEFATQSEVVFRGRSAGEMMYRPQEFVLAARMEASAGRFAAAAREMKQLAALHPNHGVKAQALGLEAGYLAQAQGGDPSKNGR